MSPSLSQAPGGLVLSCQVDSAIDARCVCLLSVDGPDMNVDIVGLGVRIMFYVQSFVFMLLSTRAALRSEIASALYTLIATNVTMTVIALILGFKQNPEISLQDAIVIGYLLLLSWISGCLGLPKYNRFISGDKAVKVVFIIHSYVLFAFVALILAKVDTFGRTPLCNVHAVGVIFLPFNALHEGRIVTFVLLVLVVALYSYNSFSDYAPILRKSCWWLDGRKVEIEGKLHDVSPDVLSSPQKDVKFGVKKIFIEQDKCIEANRRRREKDSDLGYTPIFDGTVILRIMVSVVIWTLIVVNTELLVKANRFVDIVNGASQFKLEQILLLPLVAPALASMLKAFHRHGLRRHTHKRGIKTICDSRH